MILVDKFGIYTNWCMLGLVEKPKAPNVNIGKERYYEKIFEKI